VRVHFSARVFIFKGCLILRYSCSTLCWCLQAQRQHNAPDIICKVPHALFCQLRNLVCAAYSDKAPSCSDPSVISQRASSCERHDLVLLELTLSPCKQDRQAMVPPVALSDQPRCQRQTAPLDGSNTRHAQSATTTTLPPSAAAPGEDPQARPQIISSSIQASRLLGKLFCGSDTTGKLAGTKQGHPPQQAGMPLGTAQQCAVAQAPNGAVSVSMWSDMGVQRSVTYSSAADVASSLISAMEEAPLNLREAFRVFCVDEKASIIILSQTFWETQTAAGALQSLYPLQYPYADCAVYRSPANLMDAQIKIMR
jgi:hypothetical protein